MGYLMKIVIQAQRTSSTLRTGFIRFMYLNHDGFAADDVRIPVRGLTMKRRRRQALSDLRPPRTGP